MSSPWSKVLDYAPGEPGEDVDKIIYLAAESLRIVGIVLQPYMPNKARQLLDQLGVQPHKRTFAFCKPGADLDFGESMTELGTGRERVLFPPLTSDT